MFIYLLVEGRSKYSVVLASERNKLKKSEIESAIPLHSTTTSQAILEAKEKGYIVVNPRDPFAL